MNIKYFFDRLYGKAWHRRTSDWGYRTYTYQGERVTDFHEGVDESSGKGVPIHAPDYGYVTRAGTSTRSGRYVYIWFKNGECFMCHFSEVYVKVGQVVKPGQVIAKEGNTGRSTATHLHFGVWSASKRDWVNPDAWIQNYQPIVPATMKVSPRAGLNVRTQPSITAKKITALRYLTKVNYFFSYKGWAYISYPSGTTRRFGWVKKEYLERG